MSAAQPLTANTGGEIKGFGPRWSCESFGEDGHDYYACPGCMGRYLSWLSDIRAPREAQA